MVQARKGTGRAQTHREPSRSGLGTSFALIQDSIEALAHKRPIFHSEADLQHALAWELQLSDPGAAIRLEKRVALHPSVVIDLLIETAGERLGIELKYLRRGMSAEVDGEQFDLVDGADDHGRYFAIADVARLERLLGSGVIDRGALVLLTNVANVWEPARGGRRVLYEDFRVHDGHTLGGSMRWGEWGAKGGRPAGSEGSISLSGSYPLLWHDYSTVDGVRFRYLLVEVEGG